jgi:hypothetical protein
VRILVVVGFFARNSVALVFGELLKPVSATSSTFSNPICLSNARKSFPGMAPPSHWDHFLILVLSLFGKSPTSI